MNREDIHMATKTQTQNGFKEIYLELVNEIYNQSEQGGEWSDAIYELMMLFTEIDDKDIQVLLAGALSNHKYNLVKSVFEGAIEDIPSKMAQIIQIQKVGRRLPRNLLTPSTEEGLVELLLSLIEKPKTYKDETDKLIFESNARALLIGFEVEIDNIRGLK